MAKPTDYEVLSDLGPGTELYTQRPDTAAAPKNFLFTLEAVYQFFKSQFGFPSTSRHFQTIAAATWTINHNLGRTPTIQAFIPTGVLSEFVAVEVEIVQTSLNTTTLRFTQPESGYAILTI